MCKKSYLYKCRNEKNPYCEPMVDNKMQEQARIFSVRSSFKFKTKNLARQKIYRNHGNNEYRENPEKPGQCPIEYFPNSYGKCEIFFWITSGSNRIRP